MKNNLFRRILAIVLVITMFTGQLMVGQAYAADGDLLTISDGEENVSTQATESQPTDPTPTETEAYVEPENSQKDDSTEEGSGSESIQQTPSTIADSTGGISVVISSTDNGQLKDGEKYSFTVVVKDSDLTKTPNITSDYDLSVTIPAFLTVTNLEKLMQDCTEFFSSYKTTTNANGDTVLQLKIRDKSEGTWMNIQFSIDTQASNIGYDGNGDGHITVQMGNVTSGEDQGNVDMDVGTGTGTGTGGTPGTPTTTPYLTKNIWSNYENSQYGNVGSIVMRDPNEPIGYTIKFGVKQNAGVVTLTDTLSNGVLTLSNSSGELIDGGAGKSMASCFKLYVKGVQLKHTSDSADTLTFTSDDIGAITIEKSGSGFRVVCQNDKNANSEAVIDVVVTYYTKVTGNKNDILNSVSLDVTNGTDLSDSTTIRRYDSQGLVVTKSILDADGKTFDKIYIEEINDLSLTFRLTLTQYGDNLSYSDGEVTAFDELEDCFQYANQYTVSTGAPFRVGVASADSQVVNIYKEGNDAISTGVYTVDFKVKVIPEKLHYGEKANNYLGTNVEIYRKAKLTINKTWETVDASVVKGTASFTLHNKTNGKQVAATAASDGTTFVLYLDPNQLNNGTNNCTLKETVSENSGYVAAKDIDIVVYKDKNTGDVKITKVGKTEISESDSKNGNVSVSVTNEPDSGKGTLKFKKYGGSVNESNLIDGGVYQLYRVDGSENIAVGDPFSTVNGVKEFIDLVYGTYYVKEISAPSGYVIQGNGTTGNVELKKATPNQELNLVNDLYGEGKIKIVKIDAESKNGLPGVSFTLTSTNGTQTKTTESDGVVEFTGLAAGEYTITETLPHGYSGFAGPIVVKIDENGTAQTIAASQNVTTSGNEITINWSNTQLFGSFKLTKYGATNATPLAGAKFALFDSQNNKVAEGTTDANGELTFQNLAFDTYTLKEIEAPEGYVLSSELAAGVTVKIESTTLTTQNYTNTTQKGSITITKTENGTSNKLSGAVFGLYSDAEATTLIEQKTTNGNGSCSFDNLEKGTYYVKEITAPTGYQLNKQVYKFLVGVKEDENSDTAANWTHSQTAENSKRVYKVQVTKTNEDGKVLPGAVFELSGRGIATQTATTNASGIAEFTQIPFGTYTITETAAPAGYAIAQPITFTIDSRNTPGDYDATWVFNAGVIRDDHTQLTVLKVDDRNESKGLPGTKFVIKSGEQYVVATGSAGSYVFESLNANGTEFVTGENGTFHLEYLPLGTYMLVETAAPEGYVISQEETSFEIKKAAESVTVGNTQIKAKVSLVKMDEYGKLLPGVGFTLSTAAGKVQASGDNGVYTYAGIGEEATVLYTAADGSLVIDGLLWGSYTLDEVDYPEGLVPINGVQFTVTAEKAYQEIKIDNETVRNMRLLGDITFKKVDSDSKALSGAVFKLEYVSGTDYSAKEARYAVSDANGLVTFSNVPYGVYKITEYLAPYGKQLSDEVHYVSVEGAENTEFTLTEYPFNWINEDTPIKVTFRKVSTDGIALSGAIFRILGEDQKTVIKDMLTVNDLTGAEIELPVGIYYLEEVKAPDNYVMEEIPIRFEVTLDGPNEVVVKNAPFTGSLTIVKAAQKLNENENTLLLSGAEFKVFSKVDFAQNGMQAEALYTVTTNSDGKATIDGIPFGSYVAVETKAPDGYELNTEPQYFTIGKSGEGDEVELVKNVELTFEDEKSRYVLTISKEDIRNEGQLLVGARFAVSGNGFYTEVVTGEDGTVTVAVPAMGTYQIVEIDAPEGYTIDPNVYSVEVTGHTPVNSAVLAQFVSRDYPTVVKLYKVDEAGEKLDGAAFEVYRVTDSGETLISFTLRNGAYVYDPSGEVTTIDAGTAVFEKLPTGSYLLRETKSPEGYMNLGDISFVLDEDRFDRALEIYAENLPYSRGVAICKENESGIRLAGAEFTLYSAEGEVLKAVTTTASGYAVFLDLESGSYYIQETKAPTGYQTVMTKFEFEIDGDGVLQSDFGFNNVGTADLPFYVLNVTNIPVEQQLQLKKVSSVSGAALEGAQFRILGNGVNAVYSTGSDGLTDVISLSVGEYMLTEVKAPKGYVLNADSHHLVVKHDGIELDGEALTGAIPVYTITNAPQNFLMAIVKQDETTALPLSGAAFTVTAEDGSKYYLVTDSNGMTDSITLKPGKYAVSETVAPAGYNVPLAGWNFTVDEGSQLISSISGSADYTFKDGLLTLTLTNKRTTGSLMIYKYDADDQTKPLAGAKFTVENADGKTVWFTMKNGVYHVADPDAEGAGNMLSTNAMGQALLDGLIFGNYTVKEVVAPEGYKLLTDGVHVKLTEQDETLELKLANEKLLRKVTVLKQSAGETPENLIGAVFTLYSVDAEGNRSYISEATTLYNGKAEFTVPYGDYVIVETRAPAGYELSNTEPWFFSYNAETKEDEAFTYTFVNEKTVYSLEVYKYDVDQPEQVLSGAEFAITDSRGYTKTVTTGPDGIARVEDVAYDDYTIREITAPDGYYLNDEIFTVKREELKHGAVVRVEVPNTYIIGSVTLKKVDSEDTDVILDAQFTVSDAEGNLLKWQETDEGYELSDEGESVIHAGEVVLSGLPAGDYTLAEVEAPDGYLILDETRSFTINADNAMEGIEIVIENLQRKLAVGITKIDAADSNVRLEGAEFTLYTRVNGTAGEAVMTVTTDENGLAVFADITMGDYRIVETKAPYGYKLWQNPVDFTIDADGNVLYGKNQVNVPESNKVHMFGMKNECILKELTILKSDSDDGEVLAGAVFTVTGEEGSWRVTTGEDGKALLSLPYGEYVLEELIAPDGYILDASKHLIVVAEDGITVNGKAVTELMYVIENTSVAYPVALHKQDVSNGKALSGAEFTVTGDGVSYKLKTNATGDSDTVYLTPGKYTISETKAPQSYKQPLDGWILTVSKDGRVSVEGKDAVVAVNAGSVTLTIENEKKPPVPGSDIAKTGQSKNNAMLLSGAALMLFSFTGLLCLMLDEQKRRRIRRGI